MARHAVAPKPVSAYALLVAALVVTALLAAALITFAVTSQLAAVTPWHPPMIDCSTWSVFHKTACPS